MRSVLTSEEAFRFVFLWSDDEDAIAPVADWANHSRVRTGHVAKAQRGWLAGAGTRPHLGLAQLPGLGRERAVIDLRPAIPHRRSTMRLLTLTCRRPLKRCDARRCGRSTGRLASIDFYRWPRSRSSVLCRPILLHGTPLHSHSIVPGGSLVTS